MVKYTTCINISERISKDNNGVWHCVLKFTMHRWTNGAIYVIVTKVLIIVKWWKVITKSG